jgi:hypothetical protein
LATVAAVADIGGQQLSKYIVAALENEDVYE